MNENKTDRTSPLPTPVRWVFGVAFLGLFAAIIFAIGTSPQLYESRMQAMAGFVGLGLIGSGVTVVSQKRFDSRFRNAVKHTATPLHLEGRDAVRLGITFVLIGIVASAWSSVLWWGFFTK